MPLAGQGMLLTSMDIDPSDEADFNRWYDREHLEEYTNYAKDNRTGEYLDRYVYGSLGDAALLDAAGSARLASLELT